LTETVFEICLPAAKLPLHENDVRDHAPERVTPVTVSEDDLCCLNNCSSLRQQFESGIEMQPKLFEPGCKAIFDRPVSGFSQ
jgi:hypothetical protein